MTAGLAALVVVAALTPWVVAEAGTSPRPHPAFLWRIASRPAGLYHVLSGATFVPRGANYVRLAAEPNGQVYHSTFEPGLFDRARATAFLDQMRHDRYNTVRVFIDPGSGTGVHGLGRGMGTYDTAYAPYMDNVAAFVTDAAVRGIYVLPSLDYFPHNAYYWGLAGRVNGSSTPNMDGNNLSYMDKGRVAAKAEYLANFARALRERLLPVYRTAILAYQSDNEVFFEANKAPFHRRSGSVTPLTGMTYDMADPDQRQRAANDSVVEYTRQVRQALISVDPNALLAMGFFTYQAVGKAGPDGFASHCDATCSSTVDYRYPVPAGLVSRNGTVDLLDLHIYQHHGAPVLDAHQMHHRQDPYLLGEFGALRSTYGNNLTAAAYGMRDVQREMCRLGAQGYLFFAWDTTERLASLEQFFQLAEQRGAINGQLAPIVRPDPCA